MATLLTAGNQPLHAQSSLSKNLTTYGATPMLSLLLVLSQALNFSLIAKELTPWMIVIIVGCLCWQALILIGKIPSASRFLVITVALGGCLVIALIARQLGVLSSMVHLLCFSYVLKPFELKKRADFYQLCLLGLFVLASALIFRQELLFTALFSVVLVVNIGLLLGFVSAIPSYIALAKIAAKLLLQSLPLAVALFFLLPRLSPFWQVPLANSAKTGLSERVSPGDIAQLALSSELAFRVAFDDSKPLFNQLYWRALVLDNFDGRTWSKDADANAILRAAVTGQFRFVPEITGTALNYRIFAEQSFQRWLFALDVATTVDENVVQLPDYTLVSKKPVTQTLTYQVSSYPQAKLDSSATAQILTKNLRFPANANPRLLLAAKRLREQYPQDRALIARVLKNISEQAYRYTLQPPLLANNSLDQFYFDTKAGFCAHYASAFTLLMRAAGIPARMVTGYMGGEFNQSGKYFNIYQYDAHAWSEVWLAGQGWVRVDPTAAVNPERVESGLSSELLQQQAQLGGQFFNLHRFKSIAWLNLLKQQFDALDYQWTKWIIGYNANQQHNLLTQWLGSLKPWKIGGVFALVFAGTLLLLWLGNRHRGARLSGSEWQIIYRQALLYLATWGLTKQPLQSVAQFCDEVGGQIPAIKPPFSVISLGYMQLNYQQLSSIEQQQLLTSMKQALSSLKKHLKHKRLCNNYTRYP